MTKRQREFVEHVVSCEDTGMTDKEWAGLMGVSPQTCAIWRKKPEIAKAIEDLSKEYDAGSSVLGRRTFVWSLEQMVVNYNRCLDGESSDMREARQWLLQIQKLTEPEARSSARVDYSQWSEADLEAEVFRRGLTEVEAALEGLQGVAS
jgi:hypothetical protein